VSNNDSNTTDNNNSKAKQRLPRDIPTRQRSESSATIEAFTHLVDLSRSATAKPWSRAAALVRLLLVVCCYCCVMCLCVSMTVYNTHTNQQFQQHKSPERLLPKPKPPTTSSSSIKPKSASPRRFSRSQTLGMLRLLLLWLLLY
jgi:hypothetical protein